MGKKYTQQQPPNAQFRIADGWGVYRALVLDPIGAGDVQVQETRRAFYAGAIHLFGTLVNDVSPGSETPPTPGDTQMMDDLLAEIEQWTRDLKAGRA